MVVVSVVVSAMQVQTGSPAGIFTGRGRNLQGWKRPWD
jgi:hypothetical protein